MLHPLLGAVDDPEFIKWLIQLKPEDVSPFGFAIVFIIAVVVLVEREWFVSGKHHKDVIAGLNKRIEALEADAKKKDDRIANLEKSGEESDQALKRAAEDYHKMELDLQRARMERDWQWQHSELKS